MNRDERVYAAASSVRCGFLGPANGSGFVLCGIATTATKVARTSRAIAASVRTQRLRRRQFPHMRLDLAQVILEQPRKLRRAFLEAL